MWSRLRLWKCKIKQTSKGIALDQAPLRTHQAPLLTHQTYKPCLGLFWCFIPGLEVIGVAVFDGGIATNAHLLTPRRLVRSERGGGPGGRLRAVVRGLHVKMGN